MCSMDMSMKSDSMKTKHIILSHGLSEMCRWWNGQWPRMTKRRAKFEFQLSSLLLLTCKYSWEMHLFPQLWVKQQGILDALPIVGYQFKRRKTELKTDRDTLSKIFIGLQQKNNQNKLIELELCKDSVMDYETYE